MDSLHLSFKDIIELNHIIDIKIPTVCPHFACVKVIVGGEPQILYHRNILDCIKALYGAAEFSQYLVFAPEHHYTDDSKSTYVYHEVHTGKW